MGCMFSLTHRNSLSQTMSSTKRPSPRKPRTFPDAELLNRADLMCGLDITKSTLHRWVDDGYLPAPHKLGTTPYWRRETIMSWIDAKCPAMTFTVE